MRTKNGRICEKDCPNRSPTCHGECKKYLEYFRTRRAENEQRIQEKEIEYLTDESVRRTKAGRYNRLNQYRPKYGG